MTASPADPGHPSAAGTPPAEPPFARRHIGPAPEDLVRMLKATGSDPHHFCHACFTGQYQVGFESEELAQLKLFEP